MAPTAPLVVQLDRDIAEARREAHQGKPMVSRLEGLRAVIARTESKLQEAKKAMEDAQAQVAKHSASIHEFRLELTDLERQAVGGLQANDRLFRQAMADQIRGRIGELQTCVQHSQQLNPGTVLEFLASLLGGLAEGPVLTVPTTPPTPC